MKFLILLFLALRLWGFESNTDTLKEYKVIDVEFVKYQMPYVAIRSWKEGNGMHYLVVNESTMRTRIIQTLPKSLQMNKTEFKKIKNALLHQHEKLHNFGIIAPENNNLYLTIDMCPSHKIGYENKLFSFLKQSNSTANISMSGMWMLGHQGDFDALVHSGLKIRWINHSFTHYYDKKQKDWSKNFMLKDPSTFDSEVLKTEKLLIVNHQTPSVFFRFPGLISDKFLIKKLIMTYNLLPLGTNNWLNVSNKKIQKGEIILVHGNLNEHRGIKLFFDQNQSRKYYAPIEDIFVR